jgi:hypothetical protein
LAQNDADDTKERTEKDDDPEKVDEELPAARKDPQPPAMAQPAGRIMDNSEAESALDKPGHAEPKSDLSYQINNLRRLRAQDWTKRL